MCTNRIFDWGRDRSKRGPQSSSVAGEGNFHLYLERVNEWTSKSFEQNHYTRVRNDLIEPVYIWRICIQIDSKWGSSSAQRQRERERERERAIVTKGYGFDYRPAVYFKSEKNHGGNASQGDLHLLVIKLRKAWTHSHSDLELSIL